MFPSHQFGIRNEFVVLIEYPSVLIDYSIEVEKSNSNDLVIKHGQNKAVIHASPFEIDFYQNEVLFVSANAKGLLKFEHYRTKPTKSNDDVDNEPGAWEEDFNSFHDSKPNGPEAVAMDFTFPQAGVLFGMCLSISIDFEYF